MATLKRPKIGFQAKLSLNAGRKYCHSAILLTCIKLAFVIKIFVLSIFERLFYTGFTVCRRVKKNLVSVYVLTLVLAFFPETVVYDTFYNCSSTPQTRIDHGNKRYEP